MNGAILSQDLRPDIWTPTWEIIFTIIPTRTGARTAVGSRWIAITSWSRSEKAPRVILDNCAAAHSEPTLVRQFSGFELNCVQVKEKNFRS
jgi:hypothetical protein